MQLATELIAQRRAGQDRSYRIVSGGLVFEDVLQQFRHVYDLDAVVAKRAGENVMFLLGAAHPGDGVEEQPVPVPRGDSPQLKAWTVDHDRSELANFAVDAMSVAHDSPRSRRSPGAMPPVREYHQFVA